MRENAARFRNRFWPQSPAMFTNRGTKRPAAEDDNLFPMFNKKASISSAVEGMWSSVADELLIFSPHDHKPSEKIAGFDLDYTLITTKSGRTFPVDHNDWKLWHESVPQKVKKAHEDGMKIVIFTNQKGVQAGKLKVKDLKTKIEAILAKFEVPVQVFVSLGPASFRKPYIGMWAHMEQNFNDGVPVDRAKSIYVGDAAGRTKTKLRKKDHSNGDRLFAMNLSVGFHTPEQFFLGQKTEEEHVMPEFNPETALNSEKKIFEPKVYFSADAPEMVILIGAPGSGKSTVAKMLCDKHGFEHVNGDTLKTWQACSAATNRFLADGKSVVIDNTNPDKDSRSRYMDIAQKYEIPCRCFVMTATFNHSRHNALYRTIMDPNHALIPRAAHNIFKSKYLEPDMKKEAFDQLVRVNFVPEFKDEEAKKTYSYYLLDS
ncbi:hypothetical protein L596_025634 [Steinernema carpocapsae]|uniref:PNK FHA domain-containing protein n=2 Tax=Steinernema carpocapsae TaxID=34508 RepID=A0A4V5ZYV3_STECR|nr:hypothetical protein L596_025634 [Steinernema carpocapsae]